MDPNKATTPQKKIKSIKVVFTSPQGFSLALIQWGEAATMRIGIRWDGEGESKGFPCVYGHPSWFILPKDMAISYCEQHGLPEVMAQVMLTSGEPFGE